MSLGDPPSSRDEDSGEDADGAAVAERRRDIHEANNRLAAIIMNLAFARATLEGSAVARPLDGLERSDLTTALEHAEDAANRLTEVLRRLR